MYKNQLQELAQHSCFNLPSYACVREGPDHAPRFKATVNFNGDLFESPAFFSTLRQAEHAAAEVALNTLAKRGPSRTLAAKVLDETGVYKNLLQETAHRAGLNLPVYTTMRSGPGHVPVFSSTVELGGMSFKGELAKTKKQAQKNAAMSAWHALKQMSQQGSSPSPLNSKSLEEQEQVVVARFLENLNPPDSSNLPQNKQPKERQRPSSTFKSSFPSSSFKSSPSSSTSVDSHSHNRASCNRPPEMTLHHIWLQQQAAEHQRHLMALGVSIPPLAQHRPVAPWMHPVLQHPSNHPFPVTPLYFGNQIVHEPIKARSMVTIQEIHAERPGDTSSQDPKFVMNEKLKEGKDDISLQNEKTASASLDVREKHSGPKLRNPVGVESCWPSPNMSHAPTSSYTSQSTPVRHNQMNFRPVLPAPRMQSGQYPFPRRPVLGGMQGRGFHAPFMAPAVQIRSVVPVCSAAPPRNTKSSSQERPSPDDTRNTTTGDVSGASSNLKNLRI